MTIDLKSMAIAMPEVKGHPNRAEFRGVLTVVDIPSQRSPSGANGHLVMLTRSGGGRAAFIARHGDGLFTDLGPA